jgi:hypothetical protein
VFVTDPPNIATHKLNQKACDLSTQIDAKVKAARISHISLKHNISSGHRGGAPALRAGSLSRIGCRIHCRRVFDQAVTSVPCLANVVTDSASVKSKATDRKGPVWLLEQVREFKRISELHGGLVPQAVVATPVLLGKTAVSISFTIELSAGDASLFEEIGTDENAQCGQAHC